MYLELELHRRKVAFQQRQCRKVTNPIEYLKVIEKKSSQMLIQSRCWAHFDRHKQEMYEDVVLPEFVVTILDHIENWEDPLV